MIWFEVASNPAQKQNYYSVRRGNKSAYEIKGALNAFTLSGSEPIKV